jgi:hypothetical protein
LTTLKLLVRFWMNVVLPRPLSPVGGNGSMQQQ